MDKYMKCLLWLLLGPPGSLYLGLMAGLLFGMVLGSGIEMDQPPTRSEILFDKLASPAFYIVGIGSFFYSIRKAYLTLRDG